MGGQYVECVRYKNLKSVSLLFADDNILLVSSVSDLQQAASVKWPGWETASPSLKTRLSAG